MKARRHNRSKTPGHSISDRIHAYLSGGRGSHGYPPAWPATGSGVRPFRIGVPALDATPQQAWARAVNRAVRDANVSQLDYQLSQWFKEAPEAIIVDISYGMESYDQWVLLRERDFKIPEVRDAPADSAANLFLDALTQEVVPFIEANYRTMPSDRYLFGYSSSGFFVLYALFHQPDAFQRYLSGSMVD